MRLLQRKDMKRYGCHVQAGTLAERPAHLQATHSCAVTGVAAGRPERGDFASVSEDGRLALWQLDPAALQSAAPVASAEVEPATSRRRGGGGAAPARCAFDVTGDWVVATSGAGTLAHYSLVAGEVSARGQLPEPATVRSCRHAARSSLHHELQGRSVSDAPRSVSVAPLRGLRPMSSRFGLLDLCFFPPRDL